MSSCNREGLPESRGNKETTANRYGILHQRYYDIRQLENLNQASSHLITTECPCEATQPAQQPPERQGLIFRGAECGARQCAERETCNETQGLLSAWGFWKLVHDNLADRGRR